MDLYYLQVEFSNIQQPRKEQEEEEQPRRWHTWKPTAGWRKECATEALFRQ
jgi:hypothetical protein